jgi:hypothetical protein
VYNRHIHQRANICIFGGVGLPKRKFSRHTSASVCSEDRHTAWRYICGVVRQHRIRAVAKMSASAAHQKQESSVLNVKRVIFHVFIAKACFRFLLAHAYKTYSRLTNLSEMFL